MTGSAAEAGSAAVVVECDSDSTTVLEYTSEVLVF